MEEFERVCCIVDTMYTKRHGRQLWEKSWIVRENPTVLMMATL